MRTRNILILFSATLFSLSSYAAPGKMICDSETMEHDVAWGMSVSAHRTFTSDLTEPAHRSYSQEKKVKAVENAMKRYHNGAGGYTTNQIAQAIVWAADCTENDFKWFAALIGNESSYCSARVGAGGDSGCGQFTGDAIDSMKLQLKLPSRLRGSIDTASPRSTQAMKAMIKSCYQKYNGVVDGSEGPGSEALFYNVMDRSHKGLKAVFQKASAMHVDLLASAIFLKFNTALAGGYAVPGSAPGGIARYNGGGVSNYYGKVKKQLPYIKASNKCIEDTYTPEVAKRYCEMDEDFDSCMEEFSDVYLDDSVEL